MTAPYIGYSYGRPVAAVRRRDRIVADYWHARMTHEECDGRPYCSAYSAYRGPDDMHAYSDSGHAPRRYSTAGLRVPCSRYGADGDDCAWWAVAAAFIYEEGSGDAFTYDSVNYSMGLAVNDSDGLCELVWSYWYAVPPYVRARLASGTRASVLALAYDPAALVAEYA